MMIIVWFVLSVWSYVFICSTFFCHSWWWRYCLMSWMLLLIMSTTCHMGEKESNTRVIWAWRGQGGDAPDLVEVFRDEPWGGTRWYHPFRRICFRLQALVPSPPQCHLQFISGFQLCQKQKHTEQYILNHDIVSKSWIWAATYLLLLICVPNKHESNRS